MVVYVFYIAFILFLYGVYIVFCILFLYILFLYGCYIDFIWFVYCCLYVIYIVFILLFKWLVVACCCLCTWTTSKPLWLLDHPTCCNCMLLFFHAGTVKMLVYFEYLLGINLHYTRFFPNVVPKTKKLSESCYEPLRIGSEIRQHQNGQKYESFKYYWNGYFLLEIKVRSWFLSILEVLIFQQMSYKLVYKHNSHWWWS